MSSTRKIHGEYTKSLGKYTEYTKYTDFFPRRLLRRSCFSEMIPPPVFYSAANRRTGLPKRWGVRQSSSISIWHSQACCFVYAIL